MSQQSASGETLQAVLIENEVLQGQVEVLESKVAELKQKCSLAKTLDNHVQALLHPMLMDQTQWTTSPASPWMQLCLN
jgi:hypothetical protein